MQQNHQQNALSGGKDILSNRQGVGRTWPLWLGVFLAAMVLYTATMDRGAQWQDSGWQQCRIVSGQIEHPLGLALTHSIQYYLGRAATKVLPLEPAIAITLVSCLAAALTIANVVLIVFLCTRRTAAALIAGSGLLLSHTFWQHATHTESYTIVTALLTGEWLCLARFSVTGKRRCILGLALLNGLGIANHLLASLATPVNAVVVLLLLRRKTIDKGYALAALGLWILGTLPYSLLVLSTFLQTGDLSDTLHSALFGNFASQVLNTQSLLKPVILGLGYWLYNFPNLILPLAIVGFFSRTNAPSLFSRTLKVLLVVFLIFVIRYSIRDQYTFFLPVYALTAIFAGLALAPRLPTPGQTHKHTTLVIALITILWTPPAYLLTASILEKRQAMASMVGNKPYRNGYEAFFLPWGVGQNHATTLNQHAFALAQENGLILSTSGMITFGMKYEILLGRVPPEVKVRQISEQSPPETMAELRTLLAQCIAARRPVVLVPEDRDNPQTCVPEAVWQRDGDLYVLVKLQSTPTVLNQDPEP